MTPLDRLIQRLRIRKALPHISTGGRLLDVGCADGALIRAAAGRVRDAVGIDPDAPAGSGLVRGSFPQDLRDKGPYDVIALLAVFEHVPDDERSSFVAACRALLRAGGRVVVTVPAPVVDRIVDALRRLRLVHGMDIEAHHGYRPEETPAFFERAGLRLVTHEPFELGLNHLFVFELPATS
ncbi:MAG TPA: methyltransferase domain-containing protein [Candidatus Limnocylindria bacterium]|nr:methyltransferase domain-containing protein [Candidatus Limnocylindria bacterium]